MPIVLKSVCKSFDNETVLNNFSMTVSPHDCIALMGVSGSGKTTVANIILGLVKPDSGEVIIPEGTRFSAVFQEDRLIGQLDAAGNIRLVLGNQPQRIMQELELVGLSADSKPSSDLSGGMSRRVAIVRAMIMPSDVLVLDEPFKGLDSGLKRRVMDYVKMRIDGRALILITHDRSEADYFSARIVSVG